jgi:uncharacterized protein (DUF488 family)
MFYRRKLLIGLIEAFGGQLQNTDFQKLLFAVSVRQQSPSYHFVPYKFGCFSFQAVADKSALIKTGYLHNSDKWELKDTSLFMWHVLSGQDKLAINQVKALYQNRLGKMLVKDIYIKHPYYAINSEIAHEVLTSDEYINVTEQKPKEHKPAFFTIGYEGISLEEYLNKLIRNNIKLLCDVRKNALSKKYGFSKNELKRACEGVHITYIHLPELVIPSEERKDLQNSEDYNLLFSWYEKNVLAKQAIKLNELFLLTRHYERVAITCFENCIDRCHRSRIVKAIQQLAGWNISIKHL